MAFTRDNQPTRRGGSASTYDLDALHQLLWLRADGHRHHIDIVSVELAADLHVHDRVLRRCIAKLVDQKKLRFLENIGRQSARRFVVFPPDEAVGAA